MEENEMFEAYDKNRNYGHPDDVLDAVESTLLQNMNILHNANVMLSRDAYGKGGYIDYDSLREIRMNCYALAKLVDSANSIGVFSSDVAGESNDDIFWSDLDIDENDDDLWQNEEDSENYYEEEEADASDLDDLDEDGDLK